MIQLYKLVKITSLILIASHVVAEESSSFVGVWKGQLHKAAITVCFNSDPGFGLISGVYYYQKYLQPIGLSAQNAESKVWQEGLGRKWTIELAANDQIKGVWTDTNNAKSLPISLERVKPPVDGRGFEEDCGGDVFNIPIETPPKLNTGKTVFLSGIKYRLKSIDLSLNKDEPGAEPYLITTTLEILNNTKAIQTLNKELLKLVNVEELFGCRRMYFDSSAPESGYRQLIKDIAVYGHWLSFTVSRWQNCDGRGHSIDEVSHTWNLHAGDQEDISSWFETDPNNNNPAEWLPEPLALFVYQAGKKIEPSFGKCNDNSEVEANSIIYQLQLTETGINFSIPMTRNGSCGYSVVVPYKELSPFLDDYGKDCVTEIMRRRK